MTADDLKILHSLICAIMHLSIMLRASHEMIASRGWLAVSAVYGGPRRTAFVCCRSSAGSFNRNRHMQPSSAQQTSEYSCVLWKQQHGLNETVS